MILAAPPLQDSRASYPLWCFRPGAVPHIAPAACGMQLWLTIRSINGLEMQPCLMAEDTLAAFIGLKNRGAARRRLLKVRQVPGLLLEIDRGRSAGARRRPRARWATDPTQTNYWFKVICDHRLVALAETDRLGSPWYDEAVEQLTAHARDANRLRDQLIEELATPCSSATQYAVGVGVTRTAKPEKQRRKRKRRRSRRGRR